MLRKTNKLDWLIYLVFALLAAGFFYKFLTGANVLSFRDLSLYFFPLRSLMVQLVKAGQWPLWNPYLFCGYPLLGTLQIGCFYPVSLIYYVLPFILAFNYFTIFHYYLAALFMFWLGRHFSLSRSSAFLAAIVFAFSGYLLSMANMNTTLMAMTWVPLALLFYDRLLNATGKEIVPLAIVLALIFLGGEPTVLYLTILFLLAYGLVLGKDKVKAVVGLGGALVVAFGLTAIQLFPFVETILHSMRTSMIDYAFIAEKSFPPRELINFLFPFFFGNLIKDGSYMKALLGDQHQIWLLSSYCGFFPLFFAFSAWFKRDKHVWLLWGIFIFVMFMAFGRFTPVYPLLFKFLPGVSLIRYPVKYIGLAIFSLSLLAGIGFEWWRQRVEVLAQKATIGLAGLGLVLLLVYTWLHNHQAGLFLSLQSKYHPALNDFFLENLARIIIFDIGSLGGLLGILVAGGSIFYLRSKKLISTQVWAWLLVLLVTADLAANNIVLNPTGDRRLLENDTPNIKMIKNDKAIFRVYLMPLFGQEALPVFKVYNEHLFHIKNNLTPNWLVADRIPDLGGRESMEPQDFMNFSWLYILERKGNYSQLLDMANVKYVFILKKFTEPKFKLLKIDQIGDAKGYLYQNTGCLPRAFFVRSVKVLKDREQIAKLIGEGKFNPAQEVVLEEPLTYQWRPSREKEKITFLQNDPNQVQLQTVSGQPRVLFVSDSYYPGWQVYLDGKKSKIYRANYMFRAIYLPAGKHQVRFVFSPTNFKFGALVTFLTITGIIVLLWRAKK